MRPSLRAATAIRAAEPTAMPRSMLRRVQVGPVNGLQEDGGSAAEQLAAGLRGGHGCGRHELPDVTHDRVTQVVEADDARRAGIRRPRLVGRRSGSGHAGADAVWAATCWVHQA
jgi:hypothetical protein